MQGSERDDELAWVVAAAARLGGAVLRSWRERFTVREKGRANLVTEADFAAQQAIMDFLRTRYPDHNVMGEEDIAVKQTNSPWTWIIDPLDGTTNYVHGFPYYAVSVAVACGSELRAGAIYDPTRDELFQAVRGRGARLNGQPIHVSPVTEVSQSFLVASLPVATDPGSPPVQRFLKALGSAQALQRTGSAALNLAYVSCGRVDGFWSSSLKPWDMAAGALLVMEAEGTVTALGGLPYDVFGVEVLATSTQPLHTELNELLGRS